MGKWRRNKIQQDNSRAEFTEPMAEVAVVREEEEQCFRLCSLEEKQ